MKFLARSLICTSLLLSGCALVPSQYSPQLRPVIASYNTIKPGMPRAEVEATLGKPNRDEDGAAVWELRFDDLNYAIAKVWFNAKDKVSKITVTGARGKRTPVYAAYAVSTVSK